MGGDLYEYFLVNNLLYFAIGDVSGKGIPAALYMASVVKLFRYVASKQTSTARICNTINTYMSDNSDDDMYVTMFVGVLDITTGEITFTNAGHPEPLVVHPNRRIEPLKFYSDSPIGILENYSYNEYKYTLEDGALLLLYTEHYRCRRRPVAVLRKKQVDRQHPHLPVPSSGRSHRHHSGGTAQAYP